MPEHGFYLFIVPETSSGLRLDVIVSNVIPNCSRAFSTKMIHAGNVSKVPEDILNTSELFDEDYSEGFYYTQNSSEIYQDHFIITSLKNNAYTKPGLKMKAGRWICVYIPPAERVSIQPEPIDLDVLYNDEHIAVINKKAGMVVHPAPGHYSNTLVNAIMHRFPNIHGIGGELRPGIVHRLDKDTSGIIIIAKNDIALQKFSEMFKKRELTKIYLALVYGVPKKLSGCIDFPIGRHPNDRKKMSVKAARSKEALTFYTVKEAYQNTALLEVNIKTGRTHQIRVHLSAVHHPVIGDAVYGNKSSLAAEPSVKRQLLHAEQIQFIHPFSKSSLHIIAPIPEDMQHIISKNRGDKE